MSDQKQQQIFYDNDMWCQKLTGCSELKKDWIGGIVAHHGYVLFTVCHLNFSEKTLYHIHKPRTNIYLINWHF